ncbi:MAG: hypothetical protein ABIB61_02035 [Candidatus Shapirobacteria bacterium]
MKLDTFIIGNLEKNFLRKRNNAMKKSKADLVMILNTDIEVSNVKPTLKLFEKDDKLFAVTFSPESSQSKIVKNAEFANGGSSIYRRKIWNKIGGIDLMYEPYWWDDVDYSYQAKKMGYKILADGRVKVVKKSELGTDILGRKPYSKFIYYRNHLLFLRKNKPKEFLKKFKKPLYLPLLLLVELRFRKFHNC